MNYITLILFLEYAIDFRYNYNRVLEPPTQGCKNAKTGFGIELFNNVFGIVNCLWWQQFCTR